jgi:hypothetical protein
VPGGLGENSARRHAPWLMLFAPPTPPCGRREPRKWYRQRFMTGLAIDSLQAFRSRTTARHRARLSHEQFAIPHDCCVIAAFSARSTFQFVSMISF